LNLKQSLAALAIAAAAVPAMAADQSIDLSSGFASFGATLPLLGGGDDVISFSGLAAGDYNFTVTVTSQWIGDLAGDLNGTALQMMSFGNQPVLFGYLSGTGTAPLTLTLTGTQFNSPLASYSVTMSALPVPEPSTYALMALGLAAVGFAARRRAAR